MISEQVFRQMDVQASCGPPLIKSSDEFLHNSYHTYKELKDCSIIEEVLSVGKRSEFVSLMSYSFNSEHHLLDKQGIQLLSLTVLHQAIKYICQACKPHDCLTKFEEEMTMKEPLCAELRLKGNGHFVEGDYQMAVALYSRAIKLSPFDPLLYGNRAQSYLKLKKLRQALSDAKRAVYLNPEWEKGHYRFAQAYFELGFPEKAMAVNSLAQKCCSSTLNLLCQAGAFKREMEESAAGSKTQCCSSSAEQTADRSHHHHQASGDLCSSRTKVGSKRNWKVANEKSVVHTTAPSSSSSSTSPAEKGTSRHLPSLGDHLTSDKENNCDSRSNEDEDSLCELSDDDSIPPLTYDSSDDDDDVDNLNEDILFPGDSIMSSLPSLTSPNDSDTESDNNMESDGQLAEGMDAEDLRCCDPECLVCNDDDDIDDDDDDFDLESDEDDDDDDYDDEDDEYDSDSDEDDDDDDDDEDEDEDLLSTLLLPPLLNGEVNSFTGFVLGVLHGFFTAHPEMMNEGSPPALPEVIESLPKVKLTKEQVALKLSCAICQCDYEQDEAVMELPCSHLFHPTCITTWLKMHATCPTCRDVLPH